ncbi:MAG TPA: pseudouridine-5'-phosphate glycosidase [Anaerolineales bacterium]|nr:pseudouridine-5'-phosphate glycosidase [Anaerolineales bacterium]
MTYYKISSLVAQALQAKQPVVALESTVITHGLPFPQNLELARNMEAEVRAGGSLPATIAVIDGLIHVGLEDDELERLAVQARDVGVRKVSVRDFGPAIALGECGGTTVAGTLVAAEAAGLRVFATGGIGGVHQGAPFDVSADLQQLARSPVVVVCAGAKAILDLPATLEVLETMGVPVVGYQTDEFPAFYSRSSGLPVSVRADTPGQVAAIARAHWGLGMRSAVLLTVPPPEDAALPADAVQGAIQQALTEAAAQGIHGQKVTPFMLGRVSELTHGDSLKANLALLLNNGRLAAAVARELAG